MVAAVVLAHGAFYFRVAMVADKNAFTAVAAVTHDFHVNLGYQRAGGIEYTQAAPGGFILYRTGHSMGTEDNQLVIWDFVQFIHKDRTTLTQVIHHKLVMDYLMPHIDWCTEYIQSTVNNFYSAINTRAKAAWVGESNLHE
jgi:hypothetical protein